MTLRYIQHTVKKNMLLLKDLSEILKERSISTTVDKNVYFNVLHDIVDKYNNTQHSLIKRKPKDVTDDSLVEYNEESNKKDFKFKIGDHISISKYKSIFAKG